MKTRLNCRLRPLSAALALAGLAMVPGIGIAQSTDWNAGAGGNWSIDANWTANLSFATGSIYRVEVDAAGANDRINATGAATLNGGTVDVQASAGTYQASTQYTILNAAAGRTGNSIGKGVDLFADVQTEHNSRQNNLAMLAGLRARW
ncbi:hypothetical protein [Polaromonas sp. LjRoot131]|uniref:hypothetical protein n=1 Tax=Polaromonas sp. LjRoot131 TaxID=3342262 RepID=UPI003ECD24D7